MVYLLLVLKGMNPEELINSSVKVCTQGDLLPSKFFLSLQDDLMRIFGSDKLDNMLQKFGLEEGELTIHGSIRH